jgi:hypothetical protein
VWVEIHGFEGVEVAKTDEMVVVRGMNKSNIIQRG